MDVKGVAAVITGGGTGMGAAAAEALSQAGAKVTVLGRRKEVVEETAEKIGGLGISCDVSDAGKTEKAFAEAREAHGPTRILINSAADGRLMPMLDAEGRPHSIEAFNEIIATNLFGSFNTIRLAASDMVKLEPVEDGSRGLIINVSSIGSLDGGMGGIAYIASKGGIDAMTLSLAREFGHWGVRVLTISPGAIITPMAESHIPEEIREKALKTIPFPKRTGRPDEFAKLVMHICDNTFLNGIIIRLDGARRIPYMPAGQ